MKFTGLLEDAIEENYTNMCVLRLKKIWEPADNSLYSLSQRKFTEEGLATYWKAIDASIKFWDFTLYDILCKKNKGNYLSNPLQHASMSHQVNQNPWW